MDNVEIDPVERALDLMRQAAVLLNGNHAIEIPKHLRLAIEAAEKICLSKRALDSEGAAS